MEDARRQEKRLQQQLEASTKRVAQLEAGLRKTQAAVDGFRVEFEQMRVAIMLDKATKTTAVTQLRRQRDHLRRADAHFHNLYTEEKQKVWCTPHVREERDHHSCWPM